LSKDIALIPSGGSVFKSEQNYNSDIYLIYKNVKYGDQILQQQNKKYML